jgi:hypothetical protein
MDNLSKDISVNRYSQEQYLNLTINSDERDKNYFPFTTQFQATLPNSLNNVKSIELVDLCIPNYNDNITNMNNNLTWWTGVVEDRNDPEKLGRCRVRIFGYHIDDTNILPTGDLPWALPIQPITSAATSGVGNSPVGIVPGSWVVGFFLDGEDAQQPVIMGTIAGKPSINRETTSKIKQTRELNNVLKDSNGNTVYDNDGEPIP